MTYLVQFQFDDPYRSRIKGLLVLRPKDNALYFPSKEVPLEWVGFCSSEKVQISQIDYPGTMVSDYDFTNFPEKYDFLKLRIVEEIDAILAKELD